MIEVAQFEEQKLSKLPYDRYSRGKCPHCRLVALFEEADITSNMGIHGSKRKAAEMTSSYIHLYVQLVENR